MDTYTSKGIMSELMLLGYWGPNGWLGVITLPKRKCILPAIVLTSPLNTVAAHYVLIAMEGLAPLLGNRCVVIAW